MEENKKNSHKGFKIFIIVFLVISIIFLKKENQNKIVSFLDSFNSKEKVLNVVDSFDNDGDIDSIGFYDGTIVKWGNGKLSFMNPDGTLILEKEFNFIEPVVYFGERYIYTMDKTTGDIYSLDKKGETINRLQLNKEIFNIKEIHQNLIYHIKDSNGESINILDKDGVLIGNHSFEDSNILTYTTNSSGGKNGLSLLDLKGDTLKSQIYCFDENNEKLSSLDIEGEIVIYMEFTPKDEIVVLTDRSLYIVKEGKIIWKKQFDLIKDIYILERKSIYYIVTI